MNFAYELINNTCFGRYIMRLLVLGNMANDGYSVVKELQKMHYDVDLAINKSDFGMALPQWEDAIFTEKVDAYNFSHNYKNDWVKPSWIREFDLLNNVPRKKFRFMKTMRRVELIKLMREYDFIETHVPYCIFSQFTGIPYVVYDAGWIRHFPFGNSLRNRLARRGYRKAKKIIITNPDTFKISDSLGYMKKNGTVFCPFAIDADRYKPTDASSLREQYVNHDELLLFSPSRQSWSEKGNEKMLYAFMNFKKTQPKSKFIIVSWSIDAEKSKQLAKQLRISDDIIWINPVPKSQLIQYYNASDIVLDQFVLGSWGTSTPEAMACGKPVLIYYNEYVKRAFGEYPPISSVSTIDEITRMLSLLCNDEFRNRVGQRCMEWVIKTHSARKVAMKHIEIIESCLKK